MIPVFLIKYYYQTGVYDMKKMVQLVKLNQLTEQQFKNITTYNYKYYKKEGV